MITLFVIFFYMLKFVSFSMALHIFRLISLKTDYCLVDLDLDSGRQLQYKQKAYLFSFFNYVWSASQAEREAGTIKKFLWLLWICNRVAQGGQLHPKSFSCLIHEKYFPELKSVLWCFPSLMTILGEEVCPCFACSGRTERLHSKREGEDNGGKKSIYQSESTAANHSQ